MLVKKGMGEWGQGRVEVGKGARTGSHHAATEVNGHLDGRLDILGDTQRIFRNVGCVAASKQALAEGAGSSSASVQCGWRWDGGKRTLVNRYTTPAI
jgi:hypothetical protein